jgi:2,4-dienoyl-CoA reductase-like NADH-dependent reductase (Old Yellow Enzyme family)
MPHLFDPLALRGLELRNRVVMSPMCMYSAGTDGAARPWHLAHYGARAVGGAGLIVTEATSVESRGRISEHDLGIWSDSHVETLAEIVRFCHEHGAKVGVQLAHAGRKAWSDRRGVGPEPPVAPSALPFDEGWATPRALDASTMAEVLGAWRQAARRAVAAGFDLVELHGAHGYLISEFLSPLANKREDRYAGDHAARARFALEVIAAVREEWGSRPLAIRLSCTDWAPGGNTVEDAVEFARIFRGAGVDLVDCSSGGVVSVQPTAAPGYQVPFAERIRREAGVRTMAVGLITSPEQAEEVVANERADLVALGRELLRSPYWPLEAARRLGVDLEWPKQYARARR